MGRATISADFCSTFFSLIISAMPARSQFLLDALRLLGAYRALGSELRCETFAPRTDEAIVNAVRGVLHHNPRPGCSEMLVQAHQGIVTLAGTVSSRQARQEAEQDARQVTGVYEIHNLLKIRPEYLVSAPDSCQPTQPAVAYGRNNHLCMPAPAEFAAYEPQTAETLKHLADAPR